MNTLTEQIEESRERYGLLLAGLDSMNTKKSEAQDNISSLIDQIMGSSSSRGIYGFYCTLFRALKTVSPNSTMMDSSEPPTDLESEIFGTLTEIEDVGEQYKGGKGSSLFGESETDGEESETNFVIDYSTDPLVCSTGLEVGTASATTDFMDQAEAIQNSILRPSSSGFYSYTAQDRDDITQLTQDILSWRNDLDLGTIGQELSTLQRDTISYLNGILSGAEDNSFWNIPDLSDIVDAFESLVGRDSSWVRELEDAEEALRAFEVVPSTTTTSDLPVSELTDWVQAIANGMDVYSSLLTSLPSLIESAFEISDGTSFKGFRRHWLYWILQGVDRPQSYRMDYNGSVQAISSLNKQLPSIRTAVDLVTTNKLYLPTPELNAVYIDPDTEEYVFVFTSIPCYDTVEIIAGSVRRSFSKDQVINNSEVRLSGISLSDGTMIRFRISRSSGELSEYSNKVYEAIS